MPESNKAMVLVDASQFQKDVNDLVRAGEKLGYLRGSLIVAPFPARIESISFEPEEHLLRVVLVKTSGKSDEISQI